MGRRRVDPHVTNRAPGRRDDDRLPVRACRPRAAPSSRRAASRQRPRSGQRLDLRPPRIAAYADARRLHGTRPLLRRARGGLADRGRHAGSTDEDSSRFLLHRSAVARLGGAGRLGRRRRVDSTRAVDRRRLAVHRRLSARVHRARRRLRRGGRQHKEAARRRPHVLPRLPRGRLLDLAIDGAVSRRSRRRIGVGGAGVARGRLDRDGGAAHAPHGGGASAGEGFPADLGSGARARRDRRSPGARAARRHGDDRRRRIADRRPCPETAAPRDVNTVSRAVVLGLAAAALAAARPVPPRLAALAARARLDGAIAAWCAGGFRPGRRGAFAVAVTSPTGSVRYAIIEADAMITDLARFDGAPDLSCYSRAQAADLDRTIARSETVHGRVAPRWNTTVVCAVGEATHPVCWQYSPGERKFVTVGEWTT